MGVVTRQPGGTMSWQRVAQATWWIEELMDLVDPVAWRCSDLPHASPLAASSSSSPSTFCVGFFSGDGALLP